MEDISLIINNKIKENYVYIKYVELKKKIEEDKDLKSIEDRLNCLKNEVCKNKDNESLDEYYKLEKEYKNHTLVKEYLFYKEELNVLLKDIANILSVN